MLFGYRYSNLLDKCYTVICIILDVFSLTFYSTFLNLNWKGSYFRVFNRLKILINLDLLGMMSVMFHLFTVYITNEQRWSPRGHILKSLASKVKSLALASRPQVLENWPVLGSRTALFFELLKFCGAVEKFFGKRFFVEIA